MERLTSEPDSATFSPGVDRALEILERLGAAAGGLTLSELSAQLGFPKNAVFRITNTLKARGYLARDEKTLRFRLTDKLLRVSQPRVERKGLIEVPMDAMRALRDECRETVQIGRRYGDEGVILEQVEGLHPLRISVDAGLRFPLHNNGPGKLLLAFMSDAHRVHVADHHRPAGPGARVRPHPRAGVLGRLRRGRRRHPLHRRADRRPAGRPDRDAVDFRPVAPAAPSPVHRGRRSREAGRCENLREAPAAMRSVVLLVLML